jgi:membrane-bound lytic murein transglycosylase F
VQNRVATEELIEKVENEEIAFLMADSHEIALQRRFYPELRVAFDVGEPKQLQWALKKMGDDSSLLQAMQTFFDDIKKDGRLDQLVHRYYGHVEEFNYSDLQTFSRLVRERLPKYRELFQREAKKQDMDWRLLAAIGYQESLWNAKAKSPTGVRGIMMLTQDTAKHIGIKNRSDPAESIRGGAIYFQRVLNKIPERIPQPDRTWLALASYNVGFGHLEDARKITQGNGGDPDKWIDVKQSLPLLSQKKWYKQTKHGYARGSEPVLYVENIRKYYDMLVWMDEKHNGRPGTDKPLQPKDIKMSPSL